MIDDTKREMKGAQIAGRRSTMGEYAGNHARRDDHMARNGKTHKASDPLLNGQDGDKTAPGSNVHC